MYKLCKQVICRRKYPNGPQRHEEILNHIIIGNANLKDSEIPLHIGLTGKKWKTLEILSVGEDLEKTESHTFQVENLYNQFGQ